MSAPKKQVIVFRSRVRPSAEAEYGARADAIYALAAKMPGLLSTKDFVAEDGERLALIEFASSEEREAWRVQPEHVRAQGEGRDRYYSEYNIQICELVRESRFQREPEPVAKPAPVELEGGCACRAVRYRVVGAPRFVSICHCSDCRHATGAPATAWATFSRREVTWTGTPKLRRSSERAERGFCAECGTSLTFRATAHPNYEDLTLGSLDDPTALAPRDHTYVRSQLPWLKLADGLRRYAASYEDEQG